MKITLNGLGKRYNNEWIFRKLSCEIESGDRWMITGPNGSGKSTLLQVIAGIIHPSAGSVSCQLNGQPVSDQHLFRHLSLVAPYQELIEEFTLMEMLAFHFSFKKPARGLSMAEIRDLLELHQARSKQILQFSSGMKQRVKLVCGICSDTPLLLLDEPATNLDVAGITWYHGLINRFGPERTILVCSNQIQVEGGFCRHEIPIGSYKPTGNQR